MNTESKNEWLKPEWVCNVNRWGNSHFFALECILAKEFEYDYWNNITSDTNIQKLKLIKLIFNSLTQQGEKVVSSFIDTWQELNNIKRVSIHGIFGKDL